MAAWPRRGKRRRSHVLPTEHSRPPALEPSPAEPVAPALVPRSMMDAWAVLVILLAVGGIVAMLLVASMMRWEVARVPGRIIYGALIGGAAFTLLVFAVSVVYYVLPRALGARRG